MFLESENCLHRVWYAHTQEMGSQLIWSKKTIGPTNEKKKITDLSQLTDKL